MTHRPAPAQSACRIRTLLIGLCTLLSAATACRRETPNERDAAIARGIPSSDDDVRCIADPQRSEAIAFAPVDLGAVAHEAASQERELTGPKTAVVITDSTRWEAAWRQAVDTVPPPAVRFGSDALVLVATQSYGHGPTTLAVELIRRCLTTGTVVVAMRQAWPYGGTRDIPSRGLAVVRVPRSAVHGSATRFVQLPEKK
jgi:hypothetical protein